MKRLKFFFLFTDIGFILYWLITALHLIPESWAFKDYSNPLMIAWNWSFLPLDLFISASGLSSLILYKKHKDLGTKLILISLVLTFCSGLQAIAFWTIRADFDLAWWGFNLYLLLYPLFFLVPALLKKDLE